MRTTPAIKATFRLLGTVGVWLWMLCLCTTLLTTDAEARRRYRLPAIDGGNNRYAGLVVDIRRGLVLYEQNADQKRYPASLTKMMTLYLTFEALQKGRLTMNQKLTASAYAASKPQTNLSLRAGSQITVRDAIYALIIRSANDVSVILAEQLGGSEAKFADMMTRKARELGMKDTTFKNANGLPNPGQQTTARDLVKLALALRKHYPQYYGMFRRDSFTYKGRTYRSHNRITMYYQGADGVKTGFINASGFNLVTSVRRDGHDLIAVVLGGYTAQQRDDHMRHLLDNALARLNSDNNFFRQFANQVPRPTTAKPSPSASQLAVYQSQSQDQDLFALAKQPLPTPTPEVAKARENATLEGNTVSRSKYSSMLTSARVGKVKVKDIPSPLQPVPEGILTIRDKTPKDIASVSSPASAQAPLNPAAQWGIQVGTFSNAKDAIMAAANALSIASQPLASSAIKVADVDKGSRTLHRARLSGLTQENARAACRVLISHNSPCFVYQETAEDS